MIIRIIFTVLLITANIFFSLGQKDVGKLLTVISVVSDKIENEGATSSYLKIRGWAYYSLDSLQPALRDFNKAIELDPYNHDLYARRGGIEFEMKDYNSSIIDYTKALGISPDSLNYYISRGVSYEQVGSLNQALSDYSYVLKKMPTNEFALRNRAILYCNGLSDFQKGVLDWNSLVKIYPTAEHYNDRGFLFMKRRDYEMAEKDFDNAIKKDYKNENYLAYRGFCLGMMGKTQEAIRDFSVSEKLRPDNPLLFKYRGQIFLKLGEKDKACKDFAEAKRLGLKLETLLTECK